MHIDCANCGESIPIEQSYDIGFERWCSYCNDWYTWNCATCHGVHSVLEEGVSDWDGDRHCEPCARRRFTPCYECGELRPLWSSLPCEVCELRAEEAELAIAAE